MHRSVVAHARTHLNAIDGKVELATEPVEPLFVPAKNQQQKKKKEEEEEEEEEEEQGLFVSKEQATRWRW